MSSVRSPAPGAVGLIGLGEIGQVHAAAVRQSRAARLVAVADTVPDLLAPFHAQGIRGYRDPRAHRRPRGRHGQRLPAAPPALPVTLEAIRAGKHVLVEKPLAISVAEGQQMVDAAAAAGVARGGSSRCWAKTWRADVTFTGLTGDRQLAVVSRATGKIASAKFPRLWRDLLTLSAAAAGDPAADGAVRITLPEGKTVWSSDAGVDAVLSGLLDQPVTLTATVAPGAALDRAVPEAVLRDGVDAQVPAELMEIGGGGPPGSFVDFAPLHLLTTSTLDRIAQLIPHGQADLERYRPNVVIRTAAAGFTENDWFERILRVGDDLVLRVIARTPRCAVPTLAHGALPRDPDALRVLARHNRVEPLDSLDPEPCAGVYAEVLRPGRIRTGDPVRLA